MTFQDVSGNKIHSPEAGLAAAVLIHKEYLTPTFDESSSRYHIVLEKFFERFQISSKRLKSPNRKLLILIPEVTTFPLNAI